MTYVHFFHVHCTHFPQFILNQGTGVLCPCRYRELLCTSSIPSRIPSILHPWSLTWFTCKSATGKGDSFWKPSFQVQWNFSCVPGKFLFHHPALNFDIFPLFLPGQSTMSYSGQGRDRQWRCAKFQSSVLVIALSSAINAITCSFLIIEILRHR